MFLPETNQIQQQQAIRAACDKVQSLVLQNIPPTIRQDAQVSVQEVQCGDPMCSPIDTSILIMFSSGGQGMFSAPMEAKEVTTEELHTILPPPDILLAWHRGEDPDWPPLEDGDDEDLLGYNDDGTGQQQQQQVPQMPTLRFKVDQLVECRIGPTEWAPGTITQLWYRETTWPEGSWAPYRVLLEDGREIFAPGDIDQIIRARRR